MFSIKGILMILALPLQILGHTFRYYTIGVKSRKFKNSFVKSLFLMLCRQVISLPPKDCSNVAPYTTSFLLNKIMRLVHGKAASKMNKFGSRYDENSLWLAKAPESKGTDPLVIYLHGGGYCLQIQLHQVESVMAMHQLVKKEVRDRLSVLVLDYKLAGHGYPIPHQLEQLHATYSKLVEEGHTNIILMGDSAGGNMALGYLQYLKKRSTTREVVYPSKVILISPWVNLLALDSNYETRRALYENGTYDMLNFGVFNSEVRNAVVGKRDLNDPMVSPLSPKTSPKDWNDIPTLNNKDHDLFVICGEDEIFRNDVLKWMEKALGVELFSKYKYGDSNNKLQEKHKYIRQNQAGSCNIRCYIEPWGVHDSFCFFENNAINLVESGKVKSVEQIDDVEYYGMARLVSFLNETV